MGGGGGNWRRARGQGGKLPAELDLPGSSRPASEPTHTNLHSLLAVISVGIPSLVILPISTLVARSKWDIHNAFIGLFMSYTVTGVVTQLIKVSFHSLAQCRWSISDSVPSPDSFR